MRALAFRCNYKGKKKKEIKNKEVKLMFISNDLYIKM